MSAKGFFTDTTVCIGCKACQVACKEWNGLETDSDFKMLGQSYDNTGKLSAENWRHVKFIEQFPDNGDPGRWLMMSDVCKHCKDAPCMAVCPTNAIMTTEFDTIYVQQNLCNGCRDCVGACPFGVISYSKVDKKVHKCTLCYDRLQNNLEPACAKACPTQSIIFGDKDELWNKAHARVDELKSQGRTGAYLYGDKEILGGLGAFYLLEDKPEVYGLPAAPKRVEKRVLPGSLFSIGTAIVVGIGAVLSFRGRRTRAAEAGAAPVASRTAPNTAPGTAPGDEGAAVEPREGSDG